MHGIIHRTAGADGVATVIREKAQGVGTAADIIMEA